MLAYFTCLLYGRWKEDIQGSSSLNLTIGSSQTGSNEQFRFWCCGMTELIVTSPDCISRSKIGRYVYWKTRGRADKIWRSGKAFNFTTNWITCLSTTSHSLLGYCTTFSTVQPICLNVTNKMNKDIVDCNLGTDFDFFRRDWQKNQDTSVHTSNFSSEVFRPKFYTHVLFLSRMVRVIWSIII